MSIKLAPLTSGIWENSTSDPYLLPAPAVSGLSTNNADDINRDYWDHCSFFTLQKGTALMASPSDPDLTYFYYQNVETGEKVELDFDGNGVFYQFSVMPIDWARRLEEATGDDGPYRSLYNEELGIPRNTRSTYISPVAIGGETEIGLYWQSQQNDKFFHVPDIEDHTIEGRTPYMWNRVDIAQLIWAWSKFHVASGVDTTAVNYLNKQSFLDYSEKNWNDPINQVVLDVWREAGKKQSEQIRDLVQQSGAWMGFMGGGENGPLDYKMRLIHHGLLNTNTNTIDFDDLGTKGVVTIPSMRYNDALFVNKVEATWGSFLKQDLPVDDTADEASSVSLIEGSVVGDRANVITDENYDSVITKGERIATLRLKNIPEEDYASARIAINMERWGEPVREVVFSMGPLHMDFDTGDIIKLSLDEYGLDETEFLVTKKSISLYPMPQAVITAVEWKAIGSTARMAPSDSSLDGRKTFWYTTSSGLTVDGANRVTSWEDSSQRPVDYADSSTAVVSGIGGYGAFGPEYTASNPDINGYPSIEFTDVVNSGCCFLLGTDFAGDTGILTTIESQLWMYHNASNLDQWGSSGALISEEAVAYRIFNITIVVAEYNSAGSQTLTLTFTNTTARDTFYDSVSKFWIGGYEFVVTDGTKSGSDIIWTPTWTLEEMERLFIYQANKVPDPGPGKPAFVFLYDSENDAIVYPFDHTCIAVVNPNTVERQDIYSIRAKYGLQQTADVAYGISTLGFGTYAVHGRNTNRTEDNVQAGWQIITYLQRRGTFDREDMNGTFFYRNLTRIPGANSDNQDYFSDPVYDNRSGFRAYNESPTTFGYPTIGADYGDISANQFEGDMADILFFKDALRPHELKKVIRYLGNKYGIDVEN